jgi:hypothetical protein
MGYLIAGIGVALIWPLIITIWDVDKIESRLEKIQSLLESIDSQLQQLGETPP